MAVSLANQSDQSAKYTATGTSASAHTDGSTSRSSVPFHGCATPAVRRAVRSQITESTANASTQ